MGHKEEEECKAINRKDFLWRTDKNLWHPNRAREIRKKYDVSQLEGYDRRTFIDIVLLAIIYTIVTLVLSDYFKDEPLLLCLAGWFIGGYFTNAAALGMHECSHNLVFSTWTGNFIAGMISDIPLILPAFLSFRHYHLPHHSYTTINLGENNKPSDKDNKKLPKYDPDLPTEFEAFIFSQNCLTRLLFLFFQLFAYMLRPLIQSPRRFDFFDMVTIIKHLLYQYFMYTYGGYQAILFSVCATMLGQGLHVSSMHFIAEHYQLTENTAFINNPNQAYDTFSYYGPINYVLFNGGYHTEHHDFPAVPYRNLPKLRQMAPEYYDTLPYHTSYLKVMFLFIWNHPGLYQRIKRKYDD